MKIAMYDLEGHLLEVYEIDTVFSLEKRLKMPTNTIYGCIKGFRLQSKLRQFRLVQTGLKAIIKIGDVSSLTVGQSNKAVHKYYKDKYICSYNSLKEASDKNNIDIINISKACSGVNKSAGGFEWKFA